MADAPTLCLVERKSMKLDPKTIILTIIVGNLLMSCGLYLIARVYAGQMLGVSRWARACLIQAMGWIVVGALRGVLPDVLSIVLGQVLILTALIIYLQVFAELTQQSVAKRWRYLPIGFEVLGLTYFSVVSIDLPARIAVISLACGVVMCKTIHVLLHAPRSASGVKSALSVTRKFTAGLYAVCAGVMIGRTIYYFLWQPKLPVLPFSQNAMNDASYIVFYVFSTMLTFGFLLMCNDRYIAEQNLAVQARAAHHTLFSKLSQQIPGVIYQYRLFPDGRSCFPFASDGIYQIYEFTPEQLREDARPVFGVLHPDDRAMIVDSINASATTLQPWQLEYRVVLPRQGLRWRRGDAKPEKLADGSILWHGFITDITEQALIKEKQKLLEQEVRDGYDALLVSELRLRRLMNSSMVGIIQGRQDGRLIEANDTLLHLTDYTRSELTEGQLNWFAMTDADAQMLQAAAFEQLMQQGVTRPFESEIVARNGDLIPIMLGLALLEGSSSDWVGFVVDLREQKRIDLMKAEFISIVSHELRTPLTSIRGSLGLLEAGVVGDLPQKAMQLIQVAHKNSQRLVSLVNDILDLEKLATGKMQIILRHVDLILLAQQAIEANTGYAASFRVQFVMQCNAVTLPVLADGDRLMQVFANLLSNAAKFSQRDGIVNIRVEKRENAAFVEVEDHGRGIPQEFHEQIFGKFAQADSASTRHVEGAGLGLHITKTLLEKMHGEIGFTSEVGVKTIFWFSLPLINS